MKKICVCNQKGGVGKTTTVYNLGLLLSKTKRVLLVDLDPQRNLSDLFPETIGGRGITEVLFGSDKIEDVVFKVSDNLSVLCANKELSVAESRLTDVGREYKLKEALEKVENLYDVVLVDTPPSLSVLTLNALVACSDVIVTAQADAFSMYGVVSFNNSLEAVRSYCNPGIKIIGVLLTRYTSRHALNKLIISRLENVLCGIKTKLFDTRIRECVAVREAMTARKGICEYNPNSIAAWDYKDFYEEVKNEI